MKKNNTAEKAVLDAQEISKALKEGTQKSLKDIMTEAINKMINESDDDEYGEDEDSFDVEDVNTEENDVEGENEEGCEDGNCEGAESSDDADDSDDEWSDMDEYKVGDNDYDFTGVDGETLLKVYNKLGDDDKIFVKQTGDGQFEVNDEETGAEYVIELDADSVDQDDYDEELPSEEDGDIEIELDGDDADVEFDGEDGNEDEEVEIEFDGDGEDADDELEFEFDDEEDDDDDDVINEQNDFTDTYQRDVMPGLNMNEPADSKATYSMDGGVPKGNKRPFSGYENKKSNLFTQSVNEEALDGSMPTPSANAEALEEDGSGHNTKRSTKHSSNHINRSAQQQRHSHEDGQYFSLKEDTMKRIISKVREIQNENKQYEQALVSIKKSLKEAAVLNVTLAQVVKLLSENTATNEEKKSIVERFSEVKSINESKNLYNTIKRELNESNKKAVVLERQINTVDKCNTLNETTLFKQNPSLNLWDRIENLYK